ncbi:MULTISPECIES: DUF4286 family protein [Cupriavidus]|uniref:Uncharacterized protein n=1 Tax=Cupriavidus basilensis TaxID=68895 RepID=A0A643G0V4_9BURK|nr:MULTISPECIES: DUF4286 family protein [Cupriavidus]KUE87996.1 hypothetical protein ASL20_14995 [Cupriavidus necator]NOV23767.1 hypothetical protein [Cupriavidus necator]QOT81820.1 hypothetical protein F7R26_036230 [Cupriavidus basilensis]BDB30325.1 hypothetical protein CTP10_R77420 [Cupriavidus sp. P-10]
MSGILAIWNDCNASRAAAYESWYQEEHLPERLGIAGFLTGRRFEAICASRQFLTTYEVVHPEVLRSAAYRERLAHPTARTISMMQDGFTNMSRTVCERRDLRGASRGSVVLTVALNAADAYPRLRDAVGMLEVDAAHTHSEMWISAEPDTKEISAEEALRGGDVKINACLVLEYLRPEVANRVANTLRRQFPDAYVGTYRLLCSLNQEDL